MEFPTLSNTPINQALSVIGKRIYQPNGIFYWTGRAKKEAEINATIGTAVGPETDILPAGGSHKITYYLPDIKQYMSFPPERIASYAPIAGLPALREMWKKWIIHKGKRVANMPSGPVDIAKRISTPTICNGITNAIYLTSKLFLNPGDTIICPNKRWGNYNAVLHLQSGLEIASFQFFNEDAFNIAGMLASMEQVVPTQRHVAIILNFPNNPTGYCPTPNEMAAIVQALKEFADTHQKPVVILCDDAYEGYTYSDQVCGNSIFYELVNQHPLFIPVKLDGASKEMLLYGGRIGAVTLGIHSSWAKEESLQALKDEWDNKMQGMVRSTISNANHFYQDVLLELTEGGFARVIAGRERISHILKERYDACISSFAELSPVNLTMDPHGGGFFVFLNVEGTPATDFADHLLKKYQVGTFPVANPALGINGIRVAFCSIPVQQIETCFQRIDAAIRDFQ
jgi:aspartate/methionine/tyrosine aminotransferase